MKNKNAKHKATTEIVASGKFNFIFYFPFCFIMLFSIITYGQEKPNVTSTSTTITTGSEMPPADAGTISANSPTGLTNVNSDLKTLTPVKMPIAIYSGNQNEDVELYKQTILKWKESTPEEFSRLDQLILDKFNDGLFEELFQDQLNTGNFSKKIN